MSPLWQSSCCLASRSHFKACNYLPKVFQFAFFRATQVKSYLLLQDLLQNDSDLAKGFSRVKFLVLDEADRLLETSFESELVVIAKALPTNRQTLLFSATMTKSLVVMQNAALRDAYCFQVGSH